METQWVSETQNLTQSLYASLHVVLGCDYFYAILLQSIPKLK